jgi:hypothetical protein
MWTAPGIPPWLADALAQLEKEAAQRSAAREQAEATPGGEHPTQRVWISGKTGPAMQRVEPLPFEDRTEGKESHSSEAEAMLVSMNLDPATQESERMATSAPVSESPSDGNGAEKKTSRLSGLRGLISAADLRALSQPRPAGAAACSGADAEPAVPSTLIEALTETPGRLTGLKGLVTPADLRELNPGRLQPANGGGDHSQAPARIAMKPGLRIVEAAPSPAPPAEAMAKAKPGAVPSKPPESVRDEPQAKYDELQILPSKRGQYRGKNR